MQVPEISVNMNYTMALVVIVYLVGKFLVGKIEFLRKYCIPAPVVGGLVFAMVNTALTMTGVCTIVIDTTLQTYCMLLFFVDVGLSARWKILKTGGIQILVMLVVVAVLCFSQDALGVACVSFFGENPLLGLTLGSIPLVGGHATSASFGPQLESLGAANASVVGAAAATYGLISGCMIGGPIARSRIKKLHLAEEKGYVEDIGEVKEPVPNLHAERIMPAVVTMMILIGLGCIVNVGIAACGIIMNITVGVIIVACIFRNICDAKNIQIPDAEINAVSNVGLYLFLCLAMMNLQLWQLIDLALPMIVTLLLQTILMAIFAYFIIFNIMGRDYEAAVMASGVCGFGMGATPNAVANMEAVTHSFGPAPRAFLVVPVIGSMLADTVNSLILGGFMSFFA